MSTEKDLDLEGSDGCTLEDCKAKFSTSLFDPAPLPGQRVWPEEINDSLLGILGRPPEVWRLFVDDFRKAHNIPDIKEIGESQYDYVQAFFLHHMIHLWFHHGDGWLAAADAELQCFREQKGAE